MKKLFACLVLLPLTCVLAQGVVEVEVVNEPLIVAHPVILPSELRSSVQTLTAPARQTDSTKVRFPDLLVELLEVSWSPTRSTGTGVCQIQIRINELLAFFGIWQPPGGNEKAEQWQPPGGIAGKWEPPGGIVFTPNDTIGIEVRSVNTSPKDNGVCVADFVVLAKSEIPPITDNP